MKFRFQDLAIWRMAIEIADVLFDIAEHPERKRLYRFSEQLRGAGMTMSNNITEGSGPSSHTVFRAFHLSFCFALCAMALLKKPEVF